MRITRRARHRHQHNRINTIETLDTRQETRPVFRPCVAGRSFNLISHLLHVHVSHFTFTCQTRSHLDTKRTQLRYLSNLLASISFLKCDTFYTRHAGPVLLPSMTPVHRDLWPRLQVDACEYKITSNLCVFSSPCSLYVTGYWIVRVPFPLLLICQLF
jgi:hypothetical protein